MNRNDQARRSMLSVIGRPSLRSRFGRNLRTRNQRAAPGPFQPARHPEDEWMDTVPGKHRTVIDCAAAGAAGTGVFYANNIFTANRNGYQLTDADVAVIVVLRHEATTFAYNDAMWAKYGSVLSGLGEDRGPAHESAADGQSAQLARVRSGDDQQRRHGVGTHRPRRAFRDLRHGDQSHCRCHRFGGQGHTARDLQGVGGQPPPERPHRGSRRGGSESGTGTWLHDAERWIASVSRPT